MYVDPASRNLLGKSPLPFCTGQIEGKSIALSADGRLCAVGGTDFKTHVYAVGENACVLGEEVGELYIDVKEAFL